MRSIPPRRQASATLPSRSASSSTVSRRCASFWLASLAVTLRAGCPILVLPFLQHGPMPLATRLDRLPLVSGQRYGARMRGNFGLFVGAVDRARLAAIIADRNRPQKHVWRAEVVLLTADRLGTAEIIRRTGLSKPSIWRWQERYLEAGVDGLLRDRTRPSRIPARSVRRLAFSIVPRSLGAATSSPDRESAHVRRCSAAARRTGGQALREEGGFEIDEAPVPVGGAAIAYSCLSGPPFARHSAEAETQAGCMIWKLSREFVWSIPLFAVPENAGKEGHSVYL